MVVAGAAATPVLLVISVMVMVAPGAAVAGPVRDETVRSGLSSDVTVKLTGRVVLPFPLVVLTKLTVSL